MFGCCIKMKPGEASCCETDGKEHELTVKFKIKCSPEEGCSIEAVPVKDAEEKK